MAAVLSYSPTISRTAQSNSIFKLPYPRTHFSLLQNPQILPNSKSSVSSHNFSHLGRPKIYVKSDDFIEKIEKDESLLVSDAKPAKFLFWVFLWASVSVGIYAFSGEAKAAAVDSIRASGFGVKVANALRTSGWPDEAVVFTLATLPVIELRGAIPVGYWMQLKPLMLTVLSVLGNMVPVPFIVLYLKAFATLLTGKNETASQFLNMLFKMAKEKAGPVEEFQWLGLMLFVAVPFPGTGAWTGAIIASILDMPFWPAVSANFVGVVLAGLLVNLLVNLGLKYAIVTGIILFIISTFMWSFLRSLKKSLATSN
ncbi:small multi-drug export protein [Perilla frutescens var. hirtella]|nr:small multi-drug export protein [Perilla frutescens var. hirtella]KAH6805270.1 small multi-drug export protein [Perilla frutescens var. frutescens]